MIFKDILTKRVYVKDGVEKVIWLNVGTMRVADDGKTFIELSMFPTTPFYVFDRKPKETIKTPTVDSETGEKVPDEVDVTHKTLDPETGQEIALEDIPF